MSSWTHVRAWIAAIAAAGALTGCSGGVRLEGAGEEGGEALGPTAPAVEAPESPEAPGAPGTPDAPEVNPLLNCGDGACTPDESCSSCPQDCGACPCAHDLCTVGDPLAASCDPCVAQVCAVDSFCCHFSWDVVCKLEVANICGTTCPAACGDGLCDPAAADDCSSCSQDCGACPTCGDAFCQWPEDCSTCAQDCGACPTCGNGQCEPGETCSSCTADCGACACHDVCVVGDALDPSCSPCASQVCAVDMFCCQGYWDSLCVSEAGSLCGAACPVVCGDGVCDPSAEDCSTCAQDCGACPTCGDAFCQWPEDCSTCAQDCGACPACGNAVCEWPEDCSTCTQDCGACPVCGDGTCDWTAEWCDNCPQDCGACPACGNGVCEQGETCTWCSQDCGACPCHSVCTVGDPMSASCDPCAPQICAADPYCCSSYWDDLCVSTAESLCGQVCP